MKRFKFSVSVDNTRRKYVCSRETNAFIDRSVSPKLPAFPVPDVTLMKPKTYVAVLTAFFLANNFDIFVRDAGFSLKVARIIVGVAI